MKTLFVRKIRGRAFTIRAIEPGATGPVRPRPEFFRRLAEMPRLAETPRLDHNEEEEAIVERTTGQNRKEEAITFEATVVWATVAVQ